MQIPKCYIAQRKTGEIVAISQLNSVDDEWFCHHCRCPLIFPPPTRTSSPWFEHDILHRQPEAMLQCHYLAPVNGRPSAVAKLQRLLAQLPPVITATQWQCTMCGLSYGGEKRCPQCRKGIYSREIRI
ncbi:putative zinc ribbon protein [Enterobacter hormaechei]|uniref:putative zinc ribbon protein n=1 Tax=Enterobacter hormaechei TaxID=158836 RepID=UPI0023B0E9CF|nr:putative zinc ribbon protein [Enterobacter hormaechei]MDE7575800.1 zinc-ribbon domain-containing protein [Enterobacter hormaechei]